MPRSRSLAGRFQRRRNSLGVDTSVPALLLKVGSYPIHHGSVGAVRSLGRLGIPVYAVTEDSFTPTAHSRYLRRPLVWPTTGTESVHELVAELGKRMSRVPARAVVVPTDDEAALLVAEHMDALGQWLIAPAVPADLPRRLASKAGLATLCREFDVATPVSGVPHSLAELEDIASAIGFPVVLKNDESWLRLRNPAVSSSTIVRDARELARIAARWESMPSVLVQEYVPRGRAEDWIVHLYVGDDASVVFTGIKLRSWPAHAGVTAIAESTPNPELAERTLAFCRAVGFRGVADLDWRLDTRDGRFRLLDFNPRIGAQFQMFETTAGVDVVRALHLDLTGRPVPGGPQVDGRRFIVEHLAARATLAYRHEQSAARTDGRPAAGTRLAWLEADDLMPAAVAAIRLGVPMARGLAAELPFRRRSAERDRLP